jgi:ATP-dependent protease ClpP protease subunit
MENKKANELNSENHTLFIKHIPERKIVIDREENIVNIIPKHKVYVIYIERFKELKRGLHSVLNELRTACKYDELEIRINSSGGFINEGGQFFNIINEVFHKRSTAYLDNHGYSMGAVLFCMARKRVIYPYSDLMFHNYATALNGKGGELLSKLSHKDKIIKKFFHNIIVKNGFLKEEEFEQMLIGKDYWMDAKELCQRGIATHVVYDGKMIKSKKYLKILKEEK